MRKLTSWENVWTKVDLWGRKLGGEKMEGKGGRVGRFPCFHGRGHAHRRLAFRDRLEAWTAGEKADLTKRERKKKKDEPGMMEGRTWVAARE